MVALFREVRRVLRDDGTLWLNLGDSYASTAPGTKNGSGTGLQADPGRISYRPDYRVSDWKIKAKDLMGIPWMVAFALRADGWYLRQDIIWAKPNPMPESVTDRCTKAHEYVFLLSKSARYFYDAKAVAEPAEQDGRRTTFRGGGAYVGNAAFGNSGERVTEPVTGNESVADQTRNKRSVWTIATQPYSGAHFATMPPDLAETCIKAGSSERGQCPTCGAPWVRQVERTAMVLDRSERTHELGRTRSSGTMVEPPRSETVGWAQSCTCPAHAPVPQMILDPFGGAGTTALVADRLQRNAAIIELNPTYAALARDRINGEAGLFSPVAAE
jgi:DNA modification methylase